MDWIFENLFLVVIIISAIIGFFRNDSSKQKENNERKKPAPPISRPLPPEREAQPRAERKIYKGSRPDESISTISIEEQQKSQMERLASKYSSISAKGLDNLSDSPYKKSPLKEPKNESSENKRKMKQQVSGNLDAKGLINGVIMAEILGPPRAKKTYQSVVKDRIR